MPSDGEVTLGIFGWALTSLNVGLFVPRFSDLRTEPEAWWEPCGCESIDLNKLNDPF